MLALWKQGRQCQYFSWSVGIQALWASYQVRVELAKKFKVWKKNKWSLNDNESILKSKMLP